MVIHSRRPPSFCQPRTTIISGQLSGFCSVLHGEFFFSTVGQLYASSLLFWVQFPVFMMIRDFSDYIFVLYRILSSRNIG